MAHLEAAVQARLLSERSVAWLASDDAPEAIASGPPRGAPGYIGTHVAALLGQGTVPSIAFGKKQGHSAP